MLFFFFLRANTVILFVRYPNTMEKEGEVFFGQVFPLAEGVHDVPLSLEAQLPQVEELGGQHKQGLVGTVVVD